MTELAFTFNGLDYFAKPFRGNDVKVEYEIAGKRIATGSLPVVLEAMKVLKKAGVGVK